jgi:hypothetical protein
MGILLTINTVSVFWLELLCSIVICTLVVAWYVWPYLIKLPRYSALIPLAFVHVFRYVGMTLLVPYMFDQKLPSDYINGAAYGDLLTAALALASIIALRSNGRIAIALVWVFNTWGFLDLLNGVRSLILANVPSFNLGTVWYIYTFYAPLVLLSHLMIFWILLRPKSWDK